MAIRKHHVELELATKNWAQMNTIQSCSFGSSNGPFFFAWLIQLDATLPRWAASVVSNPHSSELLHVLMGYFPRRPTPTDKQGALPNKKL